jgi:hypothetical protein
MLLKTRQYQPTGRSIRTRPAGEVGGHFYARETTSMNHTLEASATSRAAVRSSADE